MSVLKLKLVFCWFCRREGGSLYSCHCGLSSGSSLIIIKADGARAQLSIRSDVMWSVMGIPQTLLWTRCSSLSNWRSVTRNHCDVWKGFSPVRSPEVIQFNVYRVIKWVWSNSDHIEIFEFISRSLTTLLALHMCDHCRRNIWEAFHHIFFI